MWCDTEDRLLQAISGGREYTGPHACSRPLPGEPLRPALLFEVSNASIACTQPLHPLVCVCVSGVGQDIPASL